MLRYFFDLLPGMDLPFCPIELYVLALEVTLLELLFEVGQHLGLFLFSDHALLSQLGRVFQEYRLDTIHLLVH